MTGIPKLRDPSLLKEACFVGGEWVTEEQKTAATGKAVAALEAGSGIELEGAEEGRRAESPGRAH